MKTKMEMDSEGHLLIITTRSCHKNILKQDLKKIPGRQIKKLINRKEKWKDEE